MVRTEFDINNREHNNNASAKQVVLVNELGVPYQPITQVIWEIPSGTINGSNVTFTLANVPLSNSLSIYLNGIRLMFGNDYTISGLTLTMIFIPIPGDVFIAQYIY